MCFCLDRIMLNLILEWGVYYDVPLEPSRRVHTTPNNEITKLRWWKVEITKPRWWKVEITKPRWWKVENTTMKSRKYDGYWKVEITKLDTLRVFKYNSANKAESLLLLKLLILYKSGVHYLDGKTTRLKFKMTFTLQQ